MQFQADESFAYNLDKEDPHSDYRKEFYIPEETVYLNGNSLGLLSERAEKRLQRALDEWKKLGIKGWTEADPPWFWYGEKLGELTAPLVGVEPEETVITNSTTVNLHHLIATFYKPEEKGRKIIADELNFPSDLYAVKSQIALAGGDPEEDLIMIESRDGRTIDEEDITAAFSEEVGMVVLPVVQFRSGQLLDMEKITARARRHDIVVGFDLAHSIGALPHRLSELEVDFAVWCNYKYLSAGPGAVGGLYVNKKYHEKEPALAGWWGHDKETQFDMDKEFTSADTAGAWQIGTIPVLSAAPLFGTLDLINELGIENIRKRSLRLTSYLLYLIEEKLDDLNIGFSTTTPYRAERRGGHIALKPEREAFRINEALKARGIIGDFREPGIIRLTPSPLYTSFHEVWQTANVLEEIVEDKEYENFSHNRDAVT